MKRKRGAQGGDRPPKRSKETLSQSAPATIPDVDQPVLQRLYPEVFTLRHYVLSRLPGSSKNRRRKISQLGQPNSEGVDGELAQLLDSTLIGVSPKAASATRDEIHKAREKDVLTFSQQIQDCATGSTFTPGYFLQSEVGPYFLFSYNSPNPPARSFPMHVLTAAGGRFRGLVTVQKNSFLQAFPSSLPWLSTCRCPRPAWDQAMYAWDRLQLPKHLRAYVEGASMVPTSCSSWCRRRCHYDGLAA